VETATSPTPALPLSSPSQNPYRMYYPVEVVCVELIVVFFCAFSTVLSPSLPHPPSLNPNRSRSSCTCSCVGCAAGIFFSAASSWPYSPSSASPASPVPSPPRLTLPPRPGTLGTCPVSASLAPPVPSPPRLTLPPRPGTLGTCTAACHADTCPHALVTRVSRHVTRVDSVIPWSRGRSAPTKGGEPGRDTWP